MKNVRVRFAPSPTGGLHLGGVRTALFTYLFARQHAGTFILRIEDTDQNRFVPGAEEYIVDCLEWCGISPDESAQKGGDYGPYRQSERKESYRQYAEQLVADGYAYYAFDTQDELEAKRKVIPNFTYGLSTRMDMRNSLTLAPSEVEALLAAGEPHVVRVKIPEGEVVSFTDMIRGHVSFETNLIDDKVLLKADGMPTYHLAVVADDKAMEVSHVFRGEEWLPSAPIHILLWKYLGWEADMPAWVHLPLILKPDGNGKLSKRDGDRLGFPVYAQNWSDPKTGELTKGFKELGFLPEAFVNMLAMLGWNDGSDQELFSMDELIHQFSVDRISKAGAKFDFEKAKWYNHEWIKKTDARDLLIQVIKMLESDGLTLSHHAPVYIEEVIRLTKDRCVLLSDFISQAGYFFAAPSIFDVQAVKGKWNDAKRAYFEAFAEKLQEGASPAEMETLFKQQAEEHGLKPGELMLPFRIMLVGGKYGPAVFEIASLIGVRETQQRIRTALIEFQE